MRKSRDLLGLPVMDVSAGKVVGRVRQIIFSPDEQRIAGFIIGGGVIRDKTAISFDRVLSLGDDAITIAESSSVRKLAQLPELQKLLRSPVEIYSLDILTVSGKHIGNVDELLIADDGRITHLVVSEGMWRDLVRGIRTVSTRYVRAIGEDAVIVEDTAEVVSVDDAAQTDQKRQGRTAAADLSTPKAEVFLRQIREYKNRLGARRRATKANGADTEKDSVRSDITPDFDRRQKSDPEEIVDALQRSDSRQTTAGEAMSFSGSSPEQTSAAEQEVDELEQLWIGTVQKAQSVSQWVGKKIIYLHVGDEEKREAGKFENNERDTTRLSVLWEYWQEKLEAIKTGIDARSAEYLVGKRAARSVSDDGGNPIILAGEIVTESTVAAAQQAGRLYHLALACAIAEVDEKITAIRSRLTAKPPDEG